MGLEDQVKKTVSNIVSSQPKQLVNIIANPDNTLGVFSCYQDKEKTLLVLLEAVKAVALGENQKESKILKPTTEQVAKVALH